MDQEKVDGCSICDILDNPDGDVVILQTRHWRVSLAGDQYYLGRAYMTLLRHAPDMASLTFHEKSDFWRVTEQLDRIYKQRLGAHLVTYCWLMNNAFRESDPKPHVHGHIRPRYGHPVQVAGIIWTDPEFGSHHQREKTNMVPPGVLRDIRAVMLG